MILINQETITIKRRSAGSYSTSTGYYTNGTETTVTQPGNIQPANANYIDKIKDLDLSGRDISAVIQIFSENPIYTVDQSASKKADIISYNSLNYEVRHVATWSGINFNHYKAIAVLLP